MPSYVHINIEIKRSVLCQLIPTKLTFQQSSYSMAEIQCCLSYVKPLDEAIKWTMLTLTVFCDLSTRRVDRHQDSSMLAYNA